MSKAQVFSGHDYKQSIIGSLTVTRYMVSEFSGVLNIGAS